MLCTRTPSCNRISFLSLDALLNSMATIRELLNALQARDTDLFRKAASTGLSGIADEALQLSRDYADASETALDATCYEAGRQFADLARFWAKRYKDATGVEEVPKIPRFYRVD